MARQSEPKGLLKVANTKLRVGLSHRPHTYPTRHSPQSNSFHQYAQKFMVAYFCDSNYSWHFLDMIGWSFMQSKPHPIVTSKVTHIISPLRWASFSSGGLCCQVTALVLYSFQTTKFQIFITQLLTCKQGSNWVQWTLFITTFVITAKFVITSIWPAQKSADHVFFFLLLLFFRKTCFVYLLESPQRGDFNKYTKHMIHKKCSIVSVSHALDGSTSSFFITANLI